MEMKPLSEHSHVQLLEKKSSLLKEALSDRMDVLTKLGSIVAQYDTEEDLLNATESNYSIPAMKEYLSMDHSWQFSLLQ